MQGPLKIMLIFCLWNIKQGLLSQLVMPASFIEQLFCNYVESHFEPDKIRSLEKITSDHAVIIKR